MTGPKAVVAKHETPSGSIRSYTIGFVISVLLTLAAYIWTAKGVSTGWALVFLLAGLAIIQLLVQLVFFLHLGRESKPRWNLTAALFAVMVVGIVVFGSLWIMKNLSYGHHHGPSPDQTNQFIIHDEGYGQ